MKYYLTILLSLASFSMQAQRFEQPDDAKAARVMDSLWTSLPECKELKEKIAGIQNSCLVKNFSYPVYCGPETDIIHQFGSVVHFQYGYKECIRGKKKHKDKIQFIVGYSLCDNKIMAISKRKRASIFSSGAPTFPDY